MSPNPRVAALERSLKEGCHPVEGDQSIQHNGGNILTLGPDCSLPLPNPENCNQGALSELRVQDGRIGLKFIEGVGGDITVAVIANDVGAKAQLVLFEACGRPPAVDLVADSVHTRAKGGDPYYSIRLQVTEDGRTVYRVDEGHFTQHGIQSNLGGAIGPGAKTESRDGKIRLVEIPAQIPDRSYRYGSGCDLGSSALDPTAIMPLIGALILRRIRS